MAAVPGGVDGSDVGLVDGVGDGGVGGLVAVHAHPDDETLSTGALLATFAAAGRPVTVVTCTRGERGEVIAAAADPALARLEGDGPALARHRLGELAGALAALGVRDHVMLDEVCGDGPWVDSGMVWVEGAAGPGAVRAQAAPDAPPGAFALVDVEVAAERLARVLRSRRPEVVAGYEPGGGYGHPDHVQAHRVLMRAVELAAGGGPGRDGAPRAGWSVPCVLWAALDADALAAARAHAPTRPGLAAPGLDLPSAAVDGATVDVAVDVRPVLDRVLGALRAHATQVQAVEPTVGSGAALAWYALSNDVLAPVLAHESYVVAPGRGPWDGVRWPAAVRVP